MNVPADRFRTGDALDDLPDVVVRLDPEWRIADVNRAWSEKLGYAPESSLGRSFFDFVSVGSGDSVRERMSLPQPEQLFEVPIRCVSGECVTFELSLRYRSDRSSLGVLRCVEMRKRVEARLRESEAQANKLALVASRTKNAVIIADARGRVEWVNEGFTRITGYTSDEVIGCKPGDLLQGPKTDPNTVREMRDCIRAGRGFHKEILNYRKDHTPYWLDVDVQPIFDSSGNLIQFIAVEQEISEQKAAEDAVRRSEARQLAIMDAALDCIITIDRNGRLLEFNAAAERTFGYQREEILGFDLSELIIPAQHAPGHRAGIERFLRTGVSEILGKRLRNLPAQRKDRTVFPSELTVVPMDVNGEQVFTAFLRDITKEIQAEEFQKKNSEELRLARDAAEAANRAKSEFLANISHEVRTPMSAVIGYADILMDPSIETATRNQTVAAIRRNGQHLLQIINDVLDLSKIEAERLELEHIRTPLWSLISESLSMAQVKAREKGLKIEVIPSGKLPRTIATDPTRFRQILDNLLSNAVKFTASGKVRLQLGLHSLDLHRTFLRLDVEDQGIGIRADQIAKLFQPFMQADASSTRQYGGTGLGLSISRRLARAFGGDITVESVLDRGSRFRVEIPISTEDLAELVDGSSLAQAAQEGLAELLQPAETSVMGRILLAEDSIDNQRIIKYYLQRAGLSVDLAGDGRSAVQLALGGGYDVVLMDMQMPILDGYSATRELRNAGFLLPIIALTAHAMAGDEERCLRAGCSGYLSKPVDPKQLIRTLAKQIRGSGVSHFGTPVAITPMISDPIGDLFAAFRSSLPEQLSQLQKAFENGDQGTIRMLSHRLRGAAGMYQLPEVSRAAGVVEDCCKSNGNPDRLGESMIKLEKTIRQSQHIELPGQFAESAINHSALTVS